MAIFQIHEVLIYPKIPKLLQFEQSQAKWLTQFYNCCTIQLKFGNDHKKTFINIKVSP